MKPLPTALQRHAGIDLPLIGGAMYPCSNAELVAAVSKAGGLGVVQPISLTYVHGHDFREGLRLIRQLADGRPIGMNALIEQSSKYYRDRMEGWIDIALEEGIRFFITSLGNPAWVVRKVEPAGGFVYHDATEHRWGAKGRDAGVHGLIGVNRNAGGHPGNRTPEALLEELAPLGLPVVAAGGAGDAAEFVRLMQMGYAGVQVGTRFIATAECRSSDAYKKAIVDSTPDDIVLTERITGVPVAVIRTPWVERTGLKAGPIARWMLRHRRTKHLMRTIYALRSLWQLKRASVDESGEHDYWQAGRSVAGIDEVEPVSVIVGRFRDALTAATGAASDVPAAST